MRIDESIRDRARFKGILFLSCSLILFEIVTTRIFSVATWYYFAFFAISIAMFGLTLGSLAVYQLQDFFSKKPIDIYLFNCSFLQSISIVFSTLFFLSSPFYPRLTGVGIFYTTLTFLVLSLPFFFGGICISICLTKFPRVIGKMYAFDLIGASIGALITVPLLDSMDAVTVIFVSSLLGLIGSYYFAKTNVISEGTSTLKQRALKYLTLAFLLILVISASNYWLHIFRVEWVKGKYSKPVEEYWNAISRIAVYPLRIVRYPYSWGLSSTYKPTKLIKEIKIDIDGVSETVMTRFDGKNLRYIDHLKYDVTFLAHYLKKNAKIYIIGVGGGRDVAAAFLFGQKEIIGAEVNESILRLLISGKYADFTGHLDKLPRVKLMVGEARSTLTNLPEKFDIIQASCIATWSATTAGAFSLAENSLYTVDAWEIFYKHLTKEGIISFNRWFGLDYPAQLMRLTSLAAATLRNFGVKHPGKHIFIARNTPPPWRWASATILVKKTPFTNSELNQLHEVCKKLRFAIVYSPKHQNPTFQKIIDNVYNQSFFSALPLDVSPPTDDRPYFFQMLRLKDAFKEKKLKYAEQRFNLIGIQMLVVLLLISLAISLALFIVPPFIYGRSHNFRPSTIFRECWTFIIFFVCIGIGFMLFEMSLIQRLVVFLGHPSYSMTVVIFSLLLSTGLGSMVCDNWINRTKNSILAVIPILLLVIILCVTLCAMPRLIERFIVYNKPIRILVSLLILMPCGFFLGFAFPLGMNLALKTDPEQGPWLWAVNGGASVLASVIATCTSISYGISFTLKLSIISYILALVFIMMSYHLSRHKFS